ncbi:MAG: Fe-S protein assembly co-chaperone HscB [Sediminibacterium sp.]|nr:Fe-S protein assembly co-chaperone HscB [Sediminibacterium sp.]
MIPTNYFEFLQLEPTIFINEVELKQTLLKLQKQFHPDRFVLESDEKKAWAEEQSAMVNNAYKTLIHFESRLHYLLKIYQQISDADTTNLSPNFLMEMMDLNELVEEAKSANNIDAMLPIIDNNLAEIVTQFTVFNNKNAANFSNDEWQKMKHLYYQYKYISRIKENLKS